MGDKIKLTISILASNRKDTIPKCLGSILPLLNKVSSELIITDTGCDDDLVAFMGNYTDKIVKFEWCNDFAKARNVGLAMAKGEWFMYIDDDEWFEDVSELIEFFNSEEERNYTSADYIVRNYQSLNGNVYSEGVVGRIYRVYDGIIFNGRIHEDISKMPGKTKQFTSYVHHYGYAFENEEKKREHFVRNYNMLLREIEETPWDARAYAHIYQEYRFVNDYQGMVDMAYRALECVDTSDKGSKFLMCSTYATIVYANTMLKRYKEAIKWGENFIANNPLTNLAKANICSNLALAYYMENNYARSIECVDNYLHIYKTLYIQNKDTYYQELGPMLNDLFTDRKVGRVISNGVSAASNLGNIRKAVEYLLQYDWSGIIYADYKCMKEFVWVLGQTNLSCNDILYRDCVRVLGLLFSNPDCGKKVLKYITELKSANELGCRIIYDMMSRIAGQPGYNSLVSIIAAYDNGDREKILVLYDRVFNIEGCPFMMEKEFYNIADKMNIPINELYNGMNEEVFEKDLQRWSQGVRNKDIVAMKKRLDGILPPDSWCMKKFESKLIQLLEERRKTAQN